MVTITKVPKISIGNHSSAKSCIRCKIRSSVQKPIHHLASGPCGSFSTSFGRALPGFPNCRRKPFFLRRFIAK